MEINLKATERILIRPYEEKDFNKIQDLNKAEGWTTLVENYFNTKKAWEHSNVAYVAEVEGHGVIGYVRGITDTRISLFICELLIDRKYRGLGAGKEILHYVHNKYPNTRIELLANRTSRSFYEGMGFRAFYGFRKTFQE
ncbi:GNAT family N-acetyltransferase [Salinibacillus xinjiangensis]|uniref:GNAT family N-acetyltransferase n=1 Tax=Salinibacillus xinjiangensis TaxID=1229268 RepID=A0A6G1X4Y4_9BACI|nr:GNAT family N-acetyltransferase [Salinibacillus xinjiangensis]MRG86024.1 GNAT family N-acetyltransferase [Salinibacillus xinjiangensis]